MYSLAYCAVPLCGTAEGENEMAVRVVKGRLSYLCAFHARQHDLVAHAGEKKCAVRKVAAKRV